MSTAATDDHWPERRFSQAIAEGDGISIIPTIAGDVGPLAIAAEAAGAEAVLVESIGDVREARDTTSLPVVARLSEATRDRLEEARANGADAVAIDAWALVADNAAAYAHAVSLGLDCAIRVADEEELHVVLDALEPEILVPALEDGHAADDGGGLALLTEVPAGKLVLVEVSPESREEVVALERAGIDGLVVEVEPPQPPAALASMLRDLIGAEHPLD